jgi:uncharacterized protein YecE (DUF72 family)
MAHFYFGTAGWSYKDWEGIVYPERKAGGFHALTFLANYINIVEINSTFYRPPVFKISLSWIKRVENHQDFLFAVKLHQNFTHNERNYSQKDVDEFKFGVEPLKAHNRLAAILIQFPWSFSNSIRNLNYLIGLFKSFSDYPLALEIRHGSWNRSEFFQILKDHKVGFCNIDQPLINNSIPPTSINTNPEFSYARLHGRNYTNWFKKDAGRDARYDYLYSDDELDEWVKRIKELGNQSKKIFIVTNNHYRGQALANALQIKNKITGEKLDIPVNLLKRHPLLRQIIKKIERGQLDLFNDD